MRKASLQRVQRDRFREHCENAPGCKCGRGRFRLARDLRANQNARNLSFGQKQSGHFSKSSPLWMYPQIGHR